MSKDELKEELRKTILEDLYDLELRIDEAVLSMKNGEVPEVAFLMGLAATSCNAASNVQTLSALSLLEEDHVDEPER